MKRICAWCGLELDQPDGREGMPVTHGICPACRHESFPVKTADPPQRDGGDRLARSAAARRDSEGTGPP